jgi:TolB-like protein/Flp pilus assembly protein TadD
MLEQRFVFGPFTLDADRGALLRNGQPVGIGQRAVLLLAALARANGNVVTKAELIDAAWPRAVVEESNLTVQIGALRKLLGTPAEGGEYIATVARVGYRLCVPVSLREEEVAPATTPSIAVLPLVNLSGDPQQEYFADGVTEDIIMALSRFRWFQVIGRSGSFAFKGVQSGARDVARKLNVRYVLEGSVRRSPPLVRISVQLVDAASEGQLWGEQYEIGLTEVGMVQDAIAQQVAGAVEPELLRLESAAGAVRRPQGDPTVRDLVHRGTWLFHQVTKPTHLQARELFRQACAASPAFGQAHFWLARVSAGIVAYGWSATPEDDLQEGIASAIRAIHADEKDPYAHYGLAIVGVYAERLDQAIRAAQRAVELAPGFALGHLVLGMARLHSGDAPGAIVPLARGLQLNPFDPQNFVCYNTLAYSHLFAGDPGAALQFAQRAQEVRPDWSPAIATEICCHMALGHVDAAHEAHRRLSKMPAATGDTLAPLKQRNPHWAQAIAGWLQAAAG